MFFLSMFKKSEHVKLTFSADSPSKYSSSFSQSELVEIKADKHLSVAHAMGHLDRDELRQYLTMKSTSIKHDLAWKGVPPGSLLILFVPTKEWPVAARRVGMTKIEYRGATTMAIMGESKGNVSLEEAEKMLLDLTGESLDNY